MSLSPFNSLSLTVSSCMVNTNVSLPWYVIDRKILVGFHFVLQLRNKLVICFPLFQCRLVFQNWHLSIPRCLFSLPRCLFSIPRCYFLVTFRKLGGVENFNDIFAGSKRSTRWLPQLNRLCFRLPRQTKRSEIGESSPVFGRISIQI